METNSFKQVIVYFLVCCMFFNSSLPVVLAGPEGAQVENGQVTFQQSGNNTVITASDQSIINYTSFDIARPEVVQFIQPSSNASVLNRINSANPTTINGTLLANGRVYFLNPAGVLIGSSARINVTQLVASGLDMTNENFLEDRLEFVGGNGILVNNGEIIAESVYLVGKQVINAGNIICPSGNVVMASGDRVFIGEPDSHIIVEVGNIEQPELSGIQLDSQIINDGLVEVGDGKIILAVAGDALAIPAMANSGILSAANIEGDAGTIDLQAANGRIENTGTIIATSDLGTGGTITADAAEVVNSGTIDASGTDGGSISLEGSKVGQFGTINADGTTGNGGDIDIWAGEVVALGPDSVTTANAGLNGDGGEVIVFSPDTALFRSGAQIEAKGGSESGDGGFIEVSGKKHIELKGQIDLAAADGESGTFLIDPYNIIVDSSGNENGGLTDGQWDPDSDNSSLDVGILTGYLYTGDVIISTEGDGEGTQEGDVIFDFYEPGGDYYALQNDYYSGHSLTVIAADDIQFMSGSIIEFYGDGDVRLYTGPDGGITAEDKGVFNILTEGGDIIMEAGSGGIDVGRLRTGHSYYGYGTYNPGEIHLRTFNPGGDTDGYDITTGTLIVYGYGYGSIDVASAGNLTINSLTGDVSYSGQAVLLDIVPYESPDSTALACLTARKNVTINGDVIVTAVSWEAATAGLRIGAGTDSHDGTVTINGNLRAEAYGGEGRLDYAEATIKVYANNIELNGNADPLARADYAEVQTDGQDSDEQTDNETYLHYAEVDIDDTKDGTCVGCLPRAIDDSTTIEIDETIVIDVLINDEDEEGGPLTEGSVFSYTYSGDGILIAIDEDGYIVAFEYMPPTTAVFIDKGDSDEKGPYSVFSDNFQYYVQDSEGKVSTEPAIVTITVKDYSRPPEPEPEPEPKPEPEPPTIIIVPEEASFSEDLRPSELSDIGRIEGDYSSDLQWLAEELGLCQGDQSGDDENRCQEITQAYLANAFLQATDLRPHQAATQLRNLVAILHDSEGTRTAALTRVVNEFVSPDAPPTDEQMASIAGVFASHINDGTHYAAAGQWLDALVEYAGILNSDIGWSTDESVAFVMGKYGTAVTEAGDINVTAYIQMRLEGTSG